MKSSERCYTTQITNQFDTYKSPQKTSKYKRLFSLQKIRINHKGLPNDFFKPIISSREPHKKPRQNARLNTVMSQTQQLRTTPHFQQQVLALYFQPRQYKSEERKERTIVKIKPYSEEKITLQNQYTFSQSFFVQQKQQKIQKSKSKYHHKEKMKIKKDLWEDQEAVSTPQKQQLYEIVSRKNVGKQKYSKWPFGRLVQPKPKNTLPILKARFPSAFGS